MNRLIEEIIELISKEKSSYLELLKLSEDKKDILIENDVEGLDLITRKEIEILSLIENYEIKREALVREASRNLGILYEDLSFQKIIDLSPPSRQEELSTLKDDLNELIATIEASNLINKKLIQTQLKYTSFMMNQMTGGNSYGNTYNNTGSLDANKKGAFNLIDSEA